MKKRFARMIGMGMAVAMFSTAMAFAASAATVDVDWTARYTYAELVAQTKAMAEAFPEITELYEIGTTWQERPLLCLEITNEEIPAEEKTGIGVFGPIHGGEREAASCAMYFGWWMTENAGTEEVQNILDNYIIYMVPAINPDGYEQSWVLNTRQNLRPRDLDGDGVMFSDPYNDINGDGFIANVYSGKADMEPTSPWRLPEGMKSFGTESSDWNGDGIMGNDPRNSGIDMNRTFRYQFGRYDIETAGTDAQIGDIVSNYILDAETEPEIQAIEKLMATHPMDALVTLHTGEQSVLYPWCYRLYDENEPADAEILFMAETAAAMAKAASETTGRDFYSMASHDDYPTSGELIDWSFGRLNIHSYTIEVYCGGTGEYSWGDTLPANMWNFYTQDELKEMGVDVEKLTNANGDKLAEDEGLWFYTSSRNQLNSVAAEDQDVLVEGIKDAILTMIYSEPSDGAGYSVPYWMQ